MTNHDDYLTGYRAGYSDGFLDAARTTAPEPAQWQRPLTPADLPEKPQDTPQAPATPRVTVNVASEKTTPQIARDALPAEGFLTVDQVAQTFAVSRGTLRNWRRNSIGPAWTQPNGRQGRYYYHVTEVRRALTHLAKTGVLPTLEDPGS